MAESEFEAVKEVLLRHLHETADEELQAALWQVMEFYDKRTASARVIIARLIGEAVD